MLIATVTIQAFRPQRLATLRASDLRSMNPIVMATGSTRRLEVLVVLSSDTTYIATFPLCLEIDECVSRVLVSRRRCCHKSQIQ
jgi:hypothetical protein